MFAEIKYRTFEELLASVTTDMRTDALEGMINPVELIKVAQRVNADLGIKVSMSKSKMLEVDKGLMKLPSDFHVLNFALICENKREVYLPFEGTPGIPQYKTYCQGIVDGKEYALDLLRSKTMKLIEQDAVTINPGDGNIILHNLNTINYIVQVKDSDGNLLDFKISPYFQDLYNGIRIVSEAEIPVTNVKVTIIGGEKYTDDETTLYPDGCNYSPTVSYKCNNVSLSTDSSGSLCVTDANPMKVKTYYTLIPLKIEKSKSVSSECFNLHSSHHKYGMIKNGFLQCNFDAANLYINYQSMMEDDDGNLLVMDHSLVNDYYEYALKQRILENKMLNGENVDKQLSLIESRFRASRNNALSFVNTPDFSEMKKVWEMNRRAMYHKYIWGFENSTINPYQSMANRFWGRSSSQII